MEETKPSQAGLIVAYIISTVCAYFAIKSLFTFCFGDIGESDYFATGGIPFWYWWKRFLSPLLCTAITGLVVKALRSIAEKSKYVDLMFCIVVVCVAFTWFQVGIIACSGIVSLLFKLFL